MKFLFVGSNNLECWKKIALSNNPTILAAVHKLNAMEYKLDSMRVRHLPTVNFIVSKEISSSGSSYEVGQHYNATGYGIQVNIPLYSGGEVSAYVRQSVDQQRALSSLVDNTTLQILTDLTHQYRVFRTSPILIDAYKHEFYSSCLRQYATRMSVLGGQRSTIDLLNADTRYYQSLIDLNQAYYDLLLAWITIRWDAGILSLADVKKISTAFIFNKNSEYLYSPGDILKNCNFDFSK